MPFAILIIYYAGISDTFVGWVFSNYLILLPSWSSVRKAFYLPEPVKKVLSTIEKMLPKFLSQTGGPNGHKLKSE